MWWFIFVLSYHMILSRSSFGSVNVMWSDETKIEPFWYKLNSSMLEEEEFWIAHHTYCEAWGRKHDAMGQDDSSMLRKEWQCIMRFSVKTPFFYESHQFLNKYLFSTARLNGRVLLSEKPLPGETPRHTVSRKSKK